MFIHEEHSGTPGKHFRDACVSVHVCVHQMENGLGPMLTHLKIFMKSQVIQEMCTAEGISRTHQYMHKQEMNTDTHKKLLTSITLGYF